MIKSINNQLVTKSGKRLINKATKLPIYSSRVENRINKIAKELGYTKQDLTWNLLKTQVGLLK